MHTNIQTIVTVKCLDQVLQLINAPRITSGGVNDVRAEFEFCPLWDSLAKSAVFYTDPKNVYKQVLENDACDVPPEVLAVPGLMYMGVFGVNAAGDVVRTSGVLVLNIEPGAITEATAVSDPTPELYQQILAEVQKAREAAEEANPVDIDLTGAPLEYVTVQPGTGGGNGETVIVGNAITYDEQTLTSEQQAQARENIAAPGFDDLRKRVSVEAQELTKEQKAQARKNIGASQEGGLIVTVTGDTASHTAEEILAYVKNGGKAVLTDGDVVYNFAGQNPGMVDGDDPNVAFLSVNGEDDDFMLAYITGRKVHYYRFNPGNKITAPEKAQAGQVLAVKATDEVGYPTDWETVDIGGGMVVTVTGNTANISSAEIAAHVKAGGTAVLKSGEDLYSFINYSEDTGGVYFIQVDPMDGEYIEQVEVSGNKVIFYKMPFALKSKVIKTVNGAEPDENGNVNVAGAGMVVTVTDNVSSKTSAEIAAHVKNGGSVVLQIAEELYNFVGYSEDTGAVDFMRVDPMDGEYLETASVSGNRVTFYTLPFALKSEVVKITEQKLTEEQKAQARENIGAAAVGEGGGFDVSVGTTVVIPETYFSAEDGEGYKWDGLEGILFSMKGPLVIGETYTMTVNGVSYEVVAAEYGDDVGILGEDVDGYQFAVVYSPSYYGEWGDFNSSFYSDHWEFEGEDGFVVPEPTTISLARKKTTPGDVVVVKSVDENGKPKELETCNLLKREQVILPETYLEKNSPEWDEDGWLVIELKQRLIAEETYIVTVDGVEYTAAAEVREEDNIVCIDIPDVFYVDEDRDDLQRQVDFYGKESGTVSIKMLGSLPKLNLDYIDIAELLSRMPVYNGEVV